MASAGWGGFIFNLNSFSSVIFPRRLRLPLVYEWVMDPYEMGGGEKGRERCRQRHLWGAKNEFEKGFKNISRRILIRGVPSSRSLFEDL